MNINVVDCEDNDSYAFHDDPPRKAHARLHQTIAPDMSGRTRGGVQRCDTCREINDKWSAPLDGLIIKKRKFDIASTYDGVIAVSQRFKTWYKSAGLSGLEFHQLPDDLEFFAIQATRQVAFDSERRKTRFIKQCPICHRFESVVGADPVYLKEGSRIAETEFVRSDLEFGSGDEKSPLLLCGDAAAEALLKAKLKGLDLVTPEV